MTNKRLLIVQFLKEKYYKSGEKSFGHFFSDYRTRQTSGNVLLGSTKCFSNHCVCYKVMLQQLRNC